MTPLPSFKGLARNSSYTRILNSVIPRSQSDSSQTSLSSIADKRPRRGSDWSDTMSILPKEDSEERRVILRPLQMSNSDQPLSGGGSLLQRRLSRGIVTSKSSSNFASYQLPASSKEVARSNSVKNYTRRNTDPKKRSRGSSIPSEVGSSRVKVQERTISNRSLPLPGDESDYTRLRNFSTTSKGVINRGDSFRSKTSPYLNLQKPVKETQEVKSPNAVGQTKGAAHKVMLIGVEDVGKTSLRNQFMTSEYICAYDSSHEEDNDKLVTVVLNSEESQLEFEEETLFDDMISLRVMNGSLPDAFVVMYSVTSRRSYLRAKQFLYQIASRIQDQKTVVLLVGNKTDLARLRTITTEEGRNLAKDRGCKFIEISVAINHQVDELLVGILSQIRMKNKLVEKKNRRRESNAKRSSVCPGSKASGVLKKILQRACLRSKSCDNLHVL